MPSSLVENLQEQKTHRPVPDPEATIIPINHRQKALRAALQVAWLAKNEEPSHFGQQEGREASGPWENSPVLCFEERREGD